MKSFFSGIWRTIFHAIVFWFISILVIASVTYALTYNWSDPSSIRNRSTGNPLTASGWNLLVGNVDNLNERVTNVETNGGAKAWVNFNGASCSPNCTIRASYNVSSVVRNGAGDYTVNFTNAMPDANYAVVANGGEVINNSFWGPVMYPRDTQAGSVKIWCAFDNATKYDPTLASVTIFR